MYVKKNLIRLWVAVLALALPLLFIGTASAKYFSDGAVPNGSGGWTTPADGYCAVSISPTGVITTTTATSAAACNAYLITGVNSSGTATTASAVCGTLTNNTAGLKYAVPGGSTCVVLNGSGVITGALSMYGLDFTEQMCEALGTGAHLYSNLTKYGGQTPNFGTTSPVNNVCIPYGWQLAGLNPTTGAPNPVGAQGVAAGAGGTFCYTSVRTGITTTAALCPSSNPNANISNGFSMSGTQCVYAYGISGVNNAALTNINGSIVYSAGSTTLNLVGLSQGQCLAYGASWATGWGYATGVYGLNIASAITLSTSLAGNGVSEGYVFDLTKVAPGGTEGCLHCHEIGYGLDGDVYYWKDSYLKTGHKNMLRATTAVEGGVDLGGIQWAGPNGLVYTTDGTHTLNFTTTPYATITVNGVAQSLYYIYGDWIAANPDCIYIFNGYGTGPTGTTTDNSGYSCYVCHTAGASNSTTAPGIQSLSTGSIPGYRGMEPGNTYPNLLLNTANPAWDVNGIVCSRCHAVTTPAVTAAMISASSYTTAQPTSTGMGTLASGTGRVNLCFSCHSSLAYIAGSTTTKDYTNIELFPVSSYRDFSGSGVLGPEFLNSPHARYNGGTKVAGAANNVLGEYDMLDPTGTTEYDSIFKGYSCNGSLPYVSNVTGTTISTQATCSAIYGASTWKLNGDGAQGTCTTCHDVHYSLFVSSQAAAALKYTCEDCHENNIASVNGPITGATDTRAPQVTFVNHPQTPGTPFDTTLFDDPCVVCHMAEQGEYNGNQNSKPLHLWRINPSATYTSTPTVAQYYGGACSVHTGVDEDMNGTIQRLPAIYYSDLSSANCVASGGTWSAVTYNRNAQTAPETLASYDTNGTNGGTYANAVWVDLDYACGQCHGGSFGGAYTANGAPYYSKTALAAVAPFMHTSPSGTATPPGGNGGTCQQGATFVATPVVSETSVTVIGYTVSFTDASTDINTNVTPSITVNWRDGNTTGGAIGSSFTHTYTKPSTYAIYVTLTDCISSGATTSITESVPVKLTISGVVTSSTGTAATGATVVLKYNGHTRAVATSDGGGSFTFSNVIPFTGNTGIGYTLGVYDKGYTFSNPAATPGNISTSEVVTIKSVTP